MEGNDSFPHEVTIKNLIIPFNQHQYNYLPSPLLNFLLCGPASTQLKVHRLSGEGGGESYSVPVHQSGNALSLVKSTPSRQLLTVCIAFLRQTSIGCALSKIL
jgi:hypothetical protein